MTTTVEAGIAIAKANIILDHAAKNPEVFKYAQDLDKLVELCEAIVILRQEGLI